MDDNRKFQTTPPYINHSPIAPIQEVVDSGVVPKLLEFMTWEHEPQFQVPFLHRIHRFSFLIQAESSWCILNVCSNEDQFTDYILDLGGLDIILNLLDSNVDDVVSHVITKFSF